jgi:hypothetical protein
MPSNECNLYSESKFVIPYIYHIQSRIASIYSIDYILSVSRKIFEEGKNTYENRAKIENIFRYKNFNCKYTCISNEYIIETNTLRNWVLDIVTYKILDNSVSDYEKVLANFLKVESYDKIPNNFAYITSFPLYVTQEKERNKYHEIVYNIRNKSQYVGVLKKRDDFRLNIISKRLVKNAGYWVFNALENETNMVVFFTTDPNILSLNVGDTYNIRATPVKHDFSEFNKCKETRISRIQLTKTQ